MPTHVAALLSEYCTYLCIICNDEGSESAGEGETEGYVPQGHAAALLSEYNTYLCMICNDEESESAGERETEGWQDWLVALRIAALEWSP